MTGSKSTLIKKPRGKVAAETHDEDESLEKKPISIKKPVELDIAEDVLPLEDKEDPESAEAAEDAEDAANDEVGLDDDELNPFGDKWEQ